VQTRFEVAVGAFASNSVVEHVVYGAQVRSEVFVGGFASKYGINLGVV
jgi:hypothetical protein